MLDGLPPGVGPSVKAQSQSALPPGVGPAMTADQPEQPGFGQRFGEAWGVPAEEARAQIEQKEQALPTWQRLLPHTLGTSPSAGRSILNTLMPQLTAAPEALEMLKSIPTHLYSGIRESSDIQQGAVDQLRAKGYPVDQLTSGKMRPEQFKALIKPADWQEFVNTIGQAGGKSLEAVPLFGNTLSTASQDVQAGNWKGAAGGLTGLATQLALPKVIESGVKLPGRIKGTYFDPQLKTSAVRTLDATANTAQSRTLEIPHQTISKRVGALERGLKAADMVAGNGERTISLADMTPELADTAEQFKLGSERSALASPRFGAAVDAITSRGGNVSLGELMELRRDVGRLMAKSPEGSPERGALDSLYKSLKEKGADRAEEIGQLDQYNSHDSLWKTLLNYEDTSHGFGKLQNAKTGVDFFDTLRNPKYKGQIANAQADLEAAGLPKGYFDKLERDYTGLHDYAKGTGMGFMGKMKVMAQHPVLGTAGFFGGRLLGSAVGAPWLGGLIGASEAGSLASRIAAVRALERVGGAPPLASGVSAAMKAQPYEPTGEIPSLQETRQPLSRAAAASASDPKFQTVQNVAGTLIDQFKMTKTEALARARQAVENVGVDEGKAAEEAIRLQGQARGVVPTQEAAPSVSGGAQDVAEQIRRAQSAGVRGPENPYAPGPARTGFGQGGKFGIEDWPPEARQALADRIKQQQVVEGQTESEIARGGGGVGPSKAGFGKGGKLGAEDMTPERIQQIVDRIHQESALRGGSVDFNEAASQKLFGKSFAELTLDQKRQVFQEALKMRGKK